MSKLYHQTDAGTAEIILRTQCMKPGSVGLAGGGIYFATTPELTGHKAHKKGVILEATVALGKIHTLVANGDSTMTLQKLKSMGFDSVCIARAVSSGQEYVVYDPGQVTRIIRDGAQAEAAAAEAAAAEAAAKAVAEKAAAEKAAAEKAAAEADKVAAERAAAEAVAAEAERAARARQFHSLAEDATVFRLERDAAEERASEFLAKMINAAEMRAASEKAADEKAAAEKAAAERAAAEKAAAERAAAAALAEAASLRRELEAAAKKAAAEKEAADKATAEKAAAKKAADEKAAAEKAAAEKASAEKAAAEKEAAALRRELEAMRASKKAASEKAAAEKAAAERAAAEKAAAERAAAAALAEAASLRREFEAAAKKAAAEKEAADKAAAAERAAAETVAAERAAAERAARARQFHSLAEDATVFRLERDAAEERASEILAKMINEEEKRAASEKAADEKAAAEKAAAEKAAAEKAAAERAAARQLHSQRTNWSWLDDGGRWKPYEGALAASIEAAFGDANRDTLDLHAVSTGAGAAGRHTHIWGSFERNTGTWTPYSATETAAIEDAFARGHQSINLPTCFNATIHFNRFGGHHHQTTPAVGSKPEGYRSVLRGKAGMKATLHHDGSMWRLELPNFHTGYEQQVEICSTYVINFDDMMQFNMSTRRGRPIRREVPANPVVDGTWEWQDTDGSWKAYEPLACGQIALARHVGRQCTLLHDGRSNYLVDLSRSVQINMSTHTERPIRHRKATALRLPRDAASTQRSDYVRVAGSGMSAARRLLNAAAGRLLATSSSKISSTDRPDIREADFHMLVSV